MRLKLLPESDLLYSVIDLTQDKEYSCVKYDEYVAVMKKLNRFAELKKLIIKTDNYIEDNLSIITYHTE